MPKKLTQEEFIARAKAVHGDKYDYSKVEYKNSSTKVVIICPKHGEFTNIPSNHIRGFGCPKCSNERRKRLVAGVGINDVHGSTETACYDIWAAMLKRCYDEKSQIKNPAYKNCSVCEEWHTLSNFKEWYDANYVEGYDIDKDILIKGNKVYSPETCCFVPDFINSLFVSRPKRKYPMGVYKEHDKYLARLTKYGKHERIGLFKTQEKAFYVYKIEREALIKEVATTYYNRGDITKRVYDAMMRYEVEITD